MADTHEQEHLSEIAKNALYAAGMNAKKVDAFMQLEEWYPDIAEELYVIARLNV